MDTIAQLVYEKADMDTRIVMHQAYGVFKSIFWVENFAVPCAILEKKLSNVLAKRKQLPDVTIIHIHESCTLVRHICNPFIYEELVGSNFEHPERWRDHEPRHLVRRYANRYPFYIQHWSQALDHIIHCGKDIATMDELLQQFDINDERFFPIISEKISNELEYQYKSYERYVTIPDSTLGFANGDHEGYVQGVRNNICRLENIYHTFQSYINH